MAQSSGPGSESFRSKARQGLPGTHVMTDEINRPKRRRAAERDEIGGRFDRLSSAMETLRSLRDGDRGVADVAPTVSPQPRRCVSCCSRLVHVLMSLGDSLRLVLPRPLARTQRGRLTARACPMVRGAAEAAGHAASSSALGCCAHIQSAACWALLAAVKIARRSLFSTRSHEAT